jgi:hypothetical protein
MNVIRYSAGFLILSIALASLLTGSDTQQQRLWAAETEGMQLMHPVYDAGEGPERSRDSRRILYFMTGHCVLLYAREKGRFPASLEELRSHLFFLPVPHFTQWTLSRDGDFLTFEAIVSETIEPKTYMKGLYLPGSTHYMQAGAENRQSLAAIYRENPTSFPAGVSEADILAGRYSRSARDMMLSYARDEKEFLQLYSSYILGHVLKPALHAYKLIYKQYPERLEDVFPILSGSKNSEAWVSPMTGEEMVIGDKPDGSCVCYRATEDGQGYELLIPLYGAGTEKPMGLDECEFDPRKYSAGKYFKFAHNIAEGWGL